MTADTPPQCQINSTNHLSCGTTVVVMGVDRKGLRTGRRQVRAADLWITSGAATTFACTRSGFAPPLMSHAEEICSRASRPAPQARSVEERKRRGSPSLRASPVGSGSSSWRRRHCADQDAKTRMTWNATSAWSLTPSCANYVSGNTYHDCISRVNVPSLS